MNEETNNPMNGNSTQTNNQPDAQAVSNGQIIVFVRAPEQSLQEAKNYDKARGNPLKQLALGLTSTDGFFLPQTIVNKKGEPRSFESVRTSLKRWGAKLGKDHEGRAIIFKDENSGSTK